MKTRALLLAITVVLSPNPSADAREPYPEEWRDPPLEPAPDPVPFVVPEGLYYVTDTYVSDVVTTSGATTTYTTTTIHESTGTYARVLDTVDTGGRSPFDGSAFNGRGVLTDGRSLAGTYYENFVLTATGYVPVSIVFFQDDSETRRRATSSSPAQSTITPSNVPAPIQSSRESSPATGTTPPSIQDKAPGRVTPALQAGVALAPDGPLLVTAEILRGRVVRFWPRVFADGVPVAVRSWRLLSTPAAQLSADAGGAEPLSAQWLQMPPSGVTSTLRFEVVSDAAPTQRLAAQIVITVRSPALID
jgi:hypothetical protein